MEIVNSVLISLRGSGVLHQMVCCLFALFVQIYYPQIMVVIWASMLWTITSVLYDICLELESINRYLRNVTPKIDLHLDLKDLNKDK
jgi:hypothetical protein